MASNITRETRARGPGSQIDRGRSSTMEAEEPARRPATLPPELLLEIIAHSNDVKTIVRCAAGSKSLRRDMLHRDFLDRLRRRAEAKAGFDPALLMAVSYPPPASASHSDDSRQGIPASAGTHSADAVQDQKPPGFEFDAQLIVASLFKPPSSRDGLVVVPRNGKLLVFNTITGHVTSLPRLGLPRQDFRTTFMYRPALLSVDGAGRSFELLVMYIIPTQERMFTRTFSSQEGEWGAAREIDLPNLPSLPKPLTNAPAVVGCTVHWLCIINYSKVILLALHADSAQVSVIELPQDVPMARFEMSAILATTATAQGEKRLSLIVAEALVISMWTLVTAEGSNISWYRQEVIRRKEIGPLNSVLDAYQSIRFCVFGERSGTLLFWLEGSGLVQLNLGTKKALVLCKDRIRHSRHAQALLHEINLISVLKCMKTF